VNGPWLPQPGVLGVDRGAKAVRAQFKHGRGFLGRIYGRGPPFCVAIELEGTFGRVDVSIDLWRMGY